MLPKSHFLVLATVLLNIFTSVNMLSLPVLHIHTDTHNFSRWAWSYFFVPISRVWNSCLLVLILVLISLLMWTRLTGWKENSLFETEHWDTPLATDTLVWKIINYINFFMPHHTVLLINPKKMVTYKARFYWLCPWTFIYKKNILKT